MRRRWRNGTWYVLVQRDYLYIMLPSFNFNDVLRRRMNGREEKRGKIFQSSQNRSTEDAHCTDCPATWWNSILIQSNVNANTVVLSGEKFTAQSWLLRISHKWIWLYMWIYMLNIERRVDELFLLLGKSVVTFHPSEELKLPESKSAYYHTKTKQ